MKLTKSGNSSSAISSIALDPKAVTVTGTSIKVSSLLQKREGPSAGLTDADKSDLYDVINSEKQEDV